MSKEDVKYVVAVMMYGWAKDFNMKAHSDEFDGTPPSLKFTAGPLEPEADNVVKISLSSLFESDETESK